MILDKLRATHALLREIRKIESKLVISRTRLKWSRWRASTITDKNSVASLATKQLNGEIKVEEDWLAYIKEELKDLWKKKRT